MMIVVVVADGDWKKWTVALCCVDRRSYSLVADVVVVVVVSLNH